MPRATDEAEARMVKFQRLTADLRRVRLLKRSVLLVSVLLGVAAPSALADAVQSSNWAGYAAHRAGVRFTKVVAAWRQPAASCVRSHRTFSAVWVGIGGYSASSDA